MGAIAGHSLLDLLPASPGPAPSTLARLARAAQMVTRVRMSEARAREASIVRTQRLTLRPLVEHDRAEFERVLRASRDHLARFCPIDKVGDRNLDDEHAFARQVNLARRGDESGRAWRRAAFDAEGRLIGSVNINDISRGLECTGEVVLWLASDATGRGMAREMLSAAMDHAFTDLPQGLGLHKLIGLIAEDNMASRRVAVKCGFEPGLGDETIELLVNGVRVPHRPVVAYAPVAPVLNMNAGAPAGEAGRGLEAVLSLEARAATAAVA